MVLSSRVINPPGIAYVFPTQSTGGIPTLGGITGSSNLPGDPFRVLTD